MVNSMNISYDSYRIFYYVAKYQGFTQAANRLMNSQPNITRAIKNLEGALGCQLFLRSNRGVRLTPEGEKLYVHIAPAVEHIQAGEEAVAANQSLQSGVVTIAASEIALRCCLLPNIGGAIRGSASVSPTTPPPRRWLRCGTVWPILRWSPLRMTSRKA